MAIDGCKSNYSDLATNVLPKYMQKMHDAMRIKHAMEDFCADGVGVASILKKLKLEEDFSGSYVLLKNNKPFYVGISRKVVSRLRQHGYDKTHFGASLAYQMASRKMPHKMKRAEAMADPTFLKTFNVARKLISKSYVAFIEINNPLELYLFEVYCAMKLDTCEWNTFRTH